MLYLTCTTISSVDLAQYGESLAKDWVSVECGTKCINDHKIYQLEEGEGRRLAYLAKLHTQISAFIFAFCKTDEAAILKPDVSRMVYF